MRIKIQKKANNMDHYYQNKSIMAYKTDKNNKIRIYKNRIGQT